MATVIVPGSAADLIESSKICYEAFYKLNTHNGVKPPFSSDKEALNYLKSAFESKNIKFCVMKEDRSVVGFVVLDARNPQIVGIGPIVVSPGRQGKGLGKELMKYAMKRINDDYQINNLILTQVAFNSASFCLYASLGFNTAENVLHFDSKTGRTLSCDLPELSRDCTLERFCEKDLKECAELYEDSFDGHLSCTPRLKDALNQSQSESNWPSFTLKSQDGQLLGYTLGFYLDGHTLAKNVEFLKCLIAKVFQELSKEDLSVRIHVSPARYPDLVRWLTSSGFHLEKQMTVMYKGTYFQPLPTVVYLPSHSY